MKNVTSFVTVSLFAMFYYLIWLFILPITILQLFLSVVSDDDDSNVINTNKGRTV